MRRAQSRECAARDSTWSSIAVFDMVYTAFLFAGVACLLIAGLRQRPRLQLAGWALVALAVMTKGPVALLLILLLGLVLSMRAATHGHQGTTRGGMARMRRDVTRFRRLRADWRRPGRAPADRKSVV